MTRLCEAAADPRLGSDNCILHHSPGNMGWASFGVTSLWTARPNFYFATAAFGVLSSSCVEAEATTLTLSTGHVAAKLCQDISHAKRGSAVSVVSVFKQVLARLEPGEILDC